MAVAQPFYFEGGDAAVILLHTFSGTPTDVRVLGRTLQKANYTVLGPVFSGHGTPDPQQIFLRGNPELWWQDTVAAVQQLEDAGHHRIAVFGESLGGLFAMKALATLDDVVAGGTIDTPLFPVDKTNVAASFLQRSRVAYEKAGTPTDELETKMTYLTANIKAMLQSISDYTVPVKAALDSLTKPVFVAQGEADELLDPTLGRRLADDLKRTAPVTFKSYPDAPHVMTYSPQGRQLATDIIAFLQQHV